MSFYAHVVRKGTWSASGLFHLRSWGGGRNGKKKGNIGIEKGIRSKVKCRSSAHFPPISVVHELGLVLVCPFVRQAVYWGPFVAQAMQNARVILMMDEAMPIVVHWSVPALEKPPKLQLPVIYVKKYNLYALMHWGNRCNYWPKVT